MPCCARTSPATRAVTDAYLLDRTVPQDGLRCAAR